MLENWFKGIFDTHYISVIKPSDFLLCLGVSLVIGLMLAGCSMFRNRYTKSFVVTLAVLPAVVCVVIMMVNGNVGAGVAVAGAFSLVRFRSVPGTAKEIGMLFLAMGAGLVAGMGYLGYAVLFTVILGGLTMLYSLLNLGGRKDNGSQKVLSVIIPEDLNYSDVFEDIFAQYTTACELVKVKTTNMGSLYRLTYHVTLKDAAKEKEMIDAIRCRNGNLEISVSRQETTTVEL